MASCKVCECCRSYQKQLKLVSAACAAQHAVDVCWFFGRLSEHLENVSRATLQVVDSRSSAEERRALNAAVNAADITHVTSRKRAMSWGLRNVKTSQLPTQRTDRSERKMQQKDGAA